MRLLLQNISAEARAELDLRGVNFDALTASQPTYAEAYLDRSEAQFRLGKTDLARADGEAVLKTDPENVDARFDLGQLKFSTGDAAGHGRISTPSWTSTPKWPTSSQSAPSPIRRSMTMPRRRKTSRISFAPGPVERRN